MTDRTNHMAGSSTNEVTLDSWKEIATHLKRTERTVRRWEREEGLPVRRQMHKSRASVYAYPSELDAWVASRQPRAEPRRVWFRRPLAVLAALVLALTSVGSGFNASPLSAADQRTGPIARMVLSSEDMDVNNFLDVRPSPDGQYVAYSVLGNEQGGLFIRNLSSGETTALTSGKFTYHVVWSPDGKRIAYQTSMPDHALEIVEVETRTSTRLAKGMFVPFDWSPDGTRLLAQQGRQDGSSVLVSVTVSDGRITPLISQGWVAGGPYSSTAVFSPDGSYIAFSATENDNRDIFILTADGSRKARLTASPGSDRFPLWSPDGETILYQSDSALMAIPVSEGRPAGQPRYLRDVGNVGNDIPEFPVAWSASLGFSYVSFKSAGAFYSLPVDPQSGRPTGGAPTHLPSGAPGLEKAQRAVWSPDMKRLAYVGYAGEISVFSTEDSSLRVFSTGARQLPSRLSWSGDGEHIVFEMRGEAQELTLRDGRIRPIDAQIQGDSFQIRMQGKSVRVPSAPGRAAPSARWFSSADGRHLYFCSDDDRVILADAGTQKERVLASVDDGHGELWNRLLPFFSPDGSQVLLGRRSRETPKGPWKGDLWVLATDGSGGRLLASIPEVGAVAGGATPAEYRGLGFAVWDPSGRRIAYDDLNSVSVVDVKTGEQWKMPIPPEFKGVSLQQWAPDGKGIVVGLGIGSSVELWAVENPLGTAAELASNER